MPDPKSSTPESEDRSDAEVPATDAQTSSGAALFWILLIVLSFVVTLFLIFRAAV